MKEDSSLPGRLVTWVVLVLVLAGVFALLYVSYEFGASRADSSKGVFISTGPTQKQLEAMDQLTVLKIVIGDMLEGRKYKYRGAWLVRGDAVYSVDMRGVKLKDKNDTAHTAIIELPLPEVSRPRVDHEKTRTYSIERDTLIPFTGDPDKLRDESMKEAQELVERAASTDEYMKVAQRNAELILTSIYDMVGWKVTVEWLPRK